MTTTLQALDDIVERHGRDAVTDPIVLTAALRSLPAPPPGSEIDALAAAAGAGAVDRMRAAVGRGAGPAAALDAAVAAAAPSVGGRARWACSLLGAAAGLVPRHMVDTGPGADRPTDGGTERLAGDPPAPGRSRGLALAAVAVVLLAALGGGGYLISRGSGGPAPVAAPPATPAPASAPPAAATPAPATTAPPATTTGPRAAFTDPDLLAVAAPYIDAPGTVCRAGDPGLGTRESVNCKLGSGVLAIFRKLLTPDAVTELRRSFQAGNASAAPGSVRSLRWEAVPGEPGVRVGVPVGSGRPGEGLRVRFLDAETGFARLYFDEDASGVAVFLGALTPDQQVLRAFWADPDA